MWGMRSVLNGSLQKTRRKLELFVPATMAFMGDTTAGTKHVQR